MQSNGSLMDEINLDDLTFDELKKLQKDVNKAVDSFEDRRKQDARATVEAKAKEMGFSLAELMGGPSKKSRMPSPAKYRHPENPSLTWSGRGRQPGWIKEATEAGTSLDTFLTESDT